MSHSKSKTTQNARALGQGSREGIKYASQPGDLTGISASLFEVLDIVRQEETKWPEFDEFLTQNVFIPLDADIQEHLENDARDRMSGTIKQRKGGVNKKELPFVQATARDIQNFSDKYREELNAKVLPKIYETTMAQSRALILDRSVALHRSEREILELKNTWEEQSANPSFYDLLDAHKFYKELCEEFERKRECIEVVDARFKLVSELTTYYKDTLLPMASAPPTFSFDAYTPPISLFKKYGGDAIENIDKQLRPLLTAWEANHKEPFLVHELRFLETIKLNVWEPFEPVAETPNKKEFGNVLREAAQSRRPDVPKSGRPTPVRQKSPSVSAGPGRAAPADTKSPARGRSPSSATAATTPQKARRESGATLEVPGQAPQEAAPVTPVKQVVISRDIPYERPARDPVLFDQSNTSNGKKVYVIERQDEDTEGNYITVISRIRPLQGHELERGDKSVVSAVGNSIQLDRAAKNKNVTSFELSITAGPDTKQVDFFEMCQVKPLLDKALAGNYVTAFAYGQTGSGKTYSIAGPEDVIMLHEGVRIDDPTGQMPESVKRVLADVLEFQLKQHGIMPRSARYVFDQVFRAENAEPNLQYEIRCSYVEIYNENVYDLLTGNETALELKMNTGEREGFHTEGVTERLAQTTDDVMSIFMEGAKNRQVSSHLLNIESSRSHALFVLTIDRKTYDPVENTLWVRRGKLTLVDLAGSESVKTTQTSGKGLRETAGINTSLLNLSNSIAQIVKGGLSQSQHVPWRNSKLTMLLMESLTNNGSTMMIACVSPSLEYLVETTNTLTFASKAGNAARVAVKTITDAEKEEADLRADVIKYKMLNDKLTAEVERLKQLLRDNNIDFE